MVTTERTWAVLPTAQWAQLKMGRLVVPGWGLKSAMIGLVTAKSTVRSPTIGWAPPRAIGSNPLFSMTTKRRPRREKNTVKLINSLNKINSQDFSMWLLVEQCWRFFLVPSTCGPGTTDPCLQWVFQPRFAWNILPRASQCQRNPAKQPPWRDHAAASRCQTWPQVYPP